MSDPRRPNLARLVVLTLALMATPERWAFAQPLPTVAEPTPSPDGTWTADAQLEPQVVATDPTLGAGQGIVVRDGRVYAFGDVFDARPRVGVIREYTMDLKPTGREVWLRRAGRSVIRHPTGLTWDREFGTFLGDTVDRRAVIYRIDWERAWRDGNLDGAVLDTCRDDAAINGCRPEFVRVDGRTLLATADYGDVHPEIRLLDPARLLAEDRTSAPGVVVTRIMAGPWNQALHWNPERGELICVQNVIEGRGWRLETINLSRGVRDGRVEGPEVRVGRVTLARHDELEGFWRLDGGRSLWINSNRSQNMVLGTYRAIPPRPTLPE